MALGDIEDIELPYDVKENVKPKVNSTMNVLPRTSKRVRKEKPEDSIIPHTKTVYVKTFGCSHNHSDSEYMAGQLAEKGYSLTDKWEDADVVLLNSCTVKGSSESKFLDDVARAKELGKAVVVSGCVPQGDGDSWKEKEKKIDRRLKKKAEKLRRENGDTDSQVDDSETKNIWNGTSVIGVQQIEHVSYVVEETLRGNTVRLFGRGSKPGLGLPKVRANRFIEIIPINVGCLNQCTYCKTKHARGDLSSWTVKELCARVDQCIKEGVKEIRLTSEDVGAYGKDIGSNIAELLRAIVKRLPDGVMLRIGMSNPPYFMPYLDEICEILKHPNVYEFMHLPVQSGNDKVLYDMKREYTVSDFTKIVERLQEKIPHMNIMTDFICGFPTETREDFEDSIKLTEKYKFQEVNISQFYPRPGTPAARMKRVKTSEVKERSRALTKSFNSYQTWDYLVGTEQRVWINEVASDKHHLAGHTKNYCQVLIDPKEASLGSNAIVKITEAHKFYCKGKVIQLNSNQQESLPSTFSKRDEEYDTSAPIGGSKRTLKTHRKPKETNSYRLILQIIFVLLCFGLVASILFHR